MKRTPEIPLQHDMFSGALVDNRNRRQKKLDKDIQLPRQTMMFSLKETVQVGIHARPWLNQLPRPQLILEREDIRTEEEQERDLLRAAEALTGRLFNDDVTTTKAETCQDTSPKINTNETVTPPLDEKTAAYLQLVQVAQEYATTLWIDDGYKQLFYTQLPLAIIHAQASGMTAAEITAAMQAGDLAGQRIKQQADNGQCQPKISTKVSVHRSRRPRFEGYRARMRRKATPINRKRRVRL